MNASSAGSRGRPAVSVAAVQDALITLVCVFGPVLAVAELAFTLGVPPLLVAALGALVGVTVRRRLEQALSQAEQVVAFRDELNA